MKPSTIVEQYVEGDSLIARDRDWNFWVKAPGRPWQEVPMYDNNDVSDFVMHWGDPEPVTY
jgi:hypothetical protein